MQTTKDIRTRPFYSTAEIADLLRVDHPAVQAWFYGDPAAGVEPLPDTPPSSDEDAVVLSFFNFIEASVACMLSQHGLPLTEIRRIRACLSAAWQSPHPFADQRLASIDHSCADALPIDLQQTLATFASRHIAYDDPDHTDNPTRLAYRYFPAGCDGPLQVDPRYGFGGLTFKDRGLNLRVVYGHWRAGDSFDDLADGYELEPADLQRALQYADQA